MTMKILYIVGQSSGGLPHYTAELANAVAEWADVTVMKPSDSSADDLFSDEVEVVEAFRPIEVSMPKLYKLDVNPLKVAKGLLSYDQLKRIREIDADVVHDTTGLFPQVQLFAKYHGLGTDRPFVVTHHEVPVDPFSLSRPPVLAEELVKAILPTVPTSRRIVHTDKQREVLIDAGEDPEHVHVIPHGAYSVFGDHEDVTKPPERNTLLFFGHVVPPKGIDTLVEAIPLVKRAYPDVKLIVAGEGNLPRRARRIVDEHEENFEIHDYYVPNDEVKELFARAALVVTPYRSQGGSKGHSGALSTAFSFGKPVVASTAGNFPQLVEGEGCGATVPPDDPERLADAIVRLLGDDAARKEMSANSLRMARELSWENVARRHRDVYEDVLARKSKVLHPLPGDDD